MAKRKPILKQQKPKRTRVTVELPTATNDRLKQLNNTLVIKGYDSSLAKLMDKFIQEGCDNLMKELKIKSLASPDLKPLPE